MYNVFDPLLRSEGWTRVTARDKDCFFEGLSQIVRRPQFSPDEMGEYFRARTDYGSAKCAAPTTAIRQYVEAARAVQEYLWHFDRRQP
jgi:hypothetical protein